MKSLDVLATQLRRRAAYELIRSGVRELSFAAEELAEQGEKRDAHDDLAKAHAIVTILEGQAVQ